MAAITSEFATSAKLKAHILAPERQPSIKKLAADAAEVILIRLYIDQIVPYFPCPIKMTYKHSKHAVLLDAAIQDMLQGCHMIQFTY